jgi:hypothetical protein
MPWSTSLSMRPAHQTKILLSSNCLVQHNAIASTYSNGSPSMRVVGRRARTRIGGRGRVCASVRWSPSCSRPGPVASLCGTAAASVKADSETKRHLLLALLLVRSTYFPFHEPVVTTTVAAIVRTVHLLQVQALTSINFCHTRLTERQPRCRLVLTYRGDNRSVGGMSGRR